MGDSLNLQAARAFKADPRTAALSPAFL